MNVVLESIPLTVSEALLETTQSLVAAGFSNGEGEAKEMVARALGAIPKTMDLRRPDPWSAPAQKILNSLLRRRLSHVPLAHLLGEWDFLDLTLTITPDVLIPRPETEELFLLMVRIVTSSVGWGEGASQVLLDVGTGAGGLALSMARRWPKAQVVAVDLSPAVLAVARWNARRHGLESRIQFRKADLLSGVEAGTLDLVVANLPYVSTGDWAALSPEVRREPRLALDGGPDGLALIRRLIPEAAFALKVGGRLFLEVGIGQSEEAAEGMRNAGFSFVGVENDFSGIHRFVWGER
ncbi:MAG: peptide chain release factor N(5)-glutamine methyltransferase [Elusimicrobia bacterium]|nr:peptide chain release factor N(5)-glutamine methyltransferase [Elusimicrobiota bacterium]